MQPHVKAKLIDRSGNVVPVGTPGELCVAGYLVQKGYAQRLGGLGVIRRIEMAFVRI